MLKFKKNYYHANKLRASRKDQYKRFTRSGVGNFFYTLFLVVFGLYSILPMIYSIVTSFKPLDELLVFPPRFWVQRPTIANYAVLPSLLDNLQVHQYCNHNIARFGCFYGRLRAFKIEHYR